MKKACYVIMIFLFLCLICSLIYCFVHKDGESVTEFLGLKKKEIYDIRDHTQKYNLLYEFSLHNSLKAECDWSDASFTWTFPQKRTYPVYKATYSYIELQDSEEHHEQPDEKKTYNSPQKALDAFFELYPEAKEKFSYDYIPQIFDDVTASSEKMPVFTRNQSVKILSSQIGIWRDAEGKYVAALYEAQNRFKSYMINKDNPYMTVKLLDQKALKNSFAYSNMKFLNHEFLCENSDLTAFSIDDIEVVYVFSNEYILPVYKLIGTMKIQQKDITWTALVNAIDYGSLDYTIYEDSSSEREFIPKPHITSISTKDDSYSVSGYLPHRRKNIRTGEVSTSDTIKIEFLAIEETGEYYAKDQIARLEKEIVNSFKVNKNGAFTFSFSSKNFWDVEKKLYEDSKGNTLETPIYSKDDVIKRPSYDNWFRIRMCTKFTDKTYCTIQSEQYELPNI